MQRAPAHLPLFRSAGQARLLTALFLASDDQWRSLTDLAAQAGLAPSSIQREVERLAAAGLVESRRVGNVRRVRADRGSRFFADLRSLLVKAFGPRPVLARLLEGVPGIDQAYIFGSWARSELRPDAILEPPRDVDLLVVGRPDPAKVYEACAAAEREIGIPVDPLIITGEAWAGDEEHLPAAGFLAAIREGDLVPLREPSRERE